MSAPHPPPLTDSSPPRCHILRLPNELLSDIVTTAAAWPDNIDGAEFPKIYASRWSLTLACRRFHRLATPLLYSRIALTLRWTINPPLSQSSDYMPIIEERVNELQNQHGGHGVVCLHRTLAANPALRRLCRDLNLDLSDTNWQHPSFLECATDFVTWLTEVKSLRIHDGFGRARTSPVMGLLAKAARHMTALEKLTYTAHYHPGMRGELPREFEMQEVIAGFPRLRELNLAGCIKYFGADYDKLKPVRGQSPLTTLSLRDSIDGVTALTTLLAWPTRLEHFTCLGRTQWGWSPLELRHVWSALVPHLESLKTIRIGSVDNPSAASTITGMLTGVSFSQFRALTSLSVSAWSTGSDGSEGAAQALLAPRLEEFEWSFDADDGRELYLNRFGAQEEEYLRGFAKAAMEKGVPLRRIGIVFSPRPVIQSRGVGFAYLEGEELDLDYPWDRMDRLAGELRECGIAVTYNEPSVGREKFDSVVFTTGKSLGFPIM